MVHIQTILWITGKFNEKGFPSYIVQHSLKENQTILYKCYSATFSCHLFKYYLIIEQLINVKLNIFLILILSICFVIFISIHNIVCICTIITCMFYSQITDPSWSYGSWIYNYLCNQCLSPLKLCVRTPFMARCTRYNSLTFDRSVVFSGSLGSSY
jgi:hypothetical protein